jgi:O-antigen/teichoic acid export membrane protein
VARVDPDAPPTGNTGPGPSSLRLHFLSTTATSLISVTMAGLTGIYIARTLGSTARGEYASIMAWFGVTLAVGELGQTAATTFHVAKNRRDARDYVATARTLMMASGVPIAFVGFVIAPVLAHRSTSATDGYRLIFATCIVSYLGASLVYSLQAVATFRWNLVRVFQPVAYALAVVVMHVSGQLSLAGCLLATSATILMQAVLAHVVCRSTGLTGGRTSGRLVKDLVRYGSTQLAGSVPALVVARTDILALSVTVNPAHVGMYAVAASLTGLAAPAVSAIGAVAFPRIASGCASDPIGTRRLARRALAVATGVSAALAVSLVLSSHWLITTVFGSAYGDAARLMMVLAPAGAIVASAQVCSDLLRGYGRPIDVVRAQWAAAAVTAVAALIVVPRFGTLGAASVTVASAATSWILLYRYLRVAWSCRSNLPPRVSSPATWTSS